MTRKALDFVRPGGNTMNRLPRNQSSREAWFSFERHEGKEKTAKTTSYGREGKASRRKEREKVLSVCRKRTAMRKRCSRNSLTLERKG